MSLRRSAIAAVAVVGGLSAGFAIFWHFWRRRKETRRDIPKLEIAPWIGCSTIHVVSSAEEWNQVVQQLLEGVSETPVVGLDCEWVTRDDVRQPVGLLQLATPSRLVILLRLCCMDRTQLPDSLRTFLADKRILKMGVGIGEDAKKLTQDYGLQAAGCVDLRFLTSRVKPFQNLRKKGLKNLAEQILGIHFSKSPEIRRSNWNAEHLSQEQVQYSAADAQVGVDVFLMLALTKCLGRRPDSLSLEECGVDKETLWRQARSLCQGLVDVPYKEKGSSSASSSMWRGEPDSSSGRRQPQKDCTRAYSVRQKPLYHSCRLLAPDDQLLCVCDEGKVQWYLDHGLADKMGEDPLTVKLRFEPAGRPTSDRDYYAMEKENMCVVCGSTGTYIRKYIIPQEYRRYFPAALKEHRSHDVLLMCLPCHAACNLSELELRRELAEECNAPLTSSQTTRAFLNHELSRVKSSAKALLLNRSKIPAERVKILEQNVMNHYGVTDLNEDLLQLAMQIDVMEENKNYYPHGKKVVEHMRQTVGLVAFERRCRQFFLDTMKPKFLPDLWSVNHDNHKLLKKCEDEVDLPESTSNQGRGESSDLLKSPPAQAKACDVPSPQQASSSCGKESAPLLQESAETGDLGLDSVSPSMTSSHVTHRQSQHSTTDAQTNRVS